MIEEKTKQLINKIKNIRLYEYEAGKESAQNTIKKIQEDIEFYMKELELF